jgi:hypothetical protein
MSQAQETMQQPMVVWWVENQLAITFLTRERADAGPQHVIESLHLDRLNRFLSKHHFNLRSFTKDDVPHPVHKEDDEDNDDKKRDVSKSEGDTGKEGLNSQTGKYLFQPPSGEGTSVVAFFHVEKTNSGHADMAADSSSQGGLMQEGDQAAGMKKYRENDITLEVVKLVNNSLEERKKEDIPIVSSMPNWLNGGTPNGCLSHGCPTTPPIPVRDSCPSTPGRWPITFDPPLPELLSGANGEDVTIFVLDTLPQTDEITRAMKDSGSNNLLLHDMASGMKSESPFNATPPAINVNRLKLSVDLDTFNPEQPATGKDIYGCLVGFPMVDHGLFVASIIRDLAPQSSIECIRVLNDFGIGNTTALTDVFHYIQDRLAPGRDLQSRRIVINLSLVATPSDEELQAPPYNLTLQDIKPIRDGLRAPIESLASNFGVVFASSAGNDSDPRSTCPDPIMNTMMGPNRSKVRYPAAFADDNPSGPGIPQIIPVGAVNRTRAAATFSNYPGPNGIATYGGEIPTPIPVSPNPHPTVPTEADPETIDALRGVYSHVFYPGLYYLDPVPPLKRPPSEPQPTIAPAYPERDAPNPNAWAYWSGTSFATPIISALAARFLQGQPSTGDSVRQAIIGAAGSQTTTWDKLDPSISPGGSLPGPLIMAVQCTSPEIQ